MINSLHFFDKSVLRTIFERNVRKTNSSTSIFFMQLHIQAFLVLTFFLPVQINADQQSFIVDGSSSILITEDIEQLLKLLDQKGFTVKFKNLQKKECMVYSKVKTKHYGYHL